MASTIKQVVSFSFVKGLGEEPGVHNSSKQQQIGGHWDLRENLFQRAGTDRQKEHFQGLSRYHCYIKGTLYKPSL